MHLEDFKKKMVSGNLPRVIFMNSVFIRFGCFSLRIIIMMFPEKYFFTFYDKIKIGDFMSDWLVNFGYIF